MVSVIAVLSTAFSVPRKGKPLVFGAVADAFFFAGPAVSAGGGTSEDGVVIPVAAVPAGAGFADWAMLLHRRVNAEANDNRYMCEVFITELLLGYGVHEYAN